MLLTEFETVLDENGGLKMLGQSLDGTMRADRVGRVVCARKWWVHNVHSSEQHVRRELHKIVIGFLFQNAASTSFSRKICGGCVLLTLSNGQAAFRTLPSIDEKGLPHYSTEIGLVQ